VIAASARNAALPDPCRNGWPVAFRDILKLPHNYVLYLGPSIAVGDDRSTFWLLIPRRSSSDFSERGCPFALCRIGSAFFVADVDLSCSRRVRVAERIRRPCGGYREKIGLPTSRGKSA